MGTDLLSVLSYVSLTKALNERKPGIPNPWPAKFFKRRGEAVVGNVARSTVFYGSRRVARSTRFGAGGRRRQQSKAGYQDVILLHTREEDVFDAYILMQLRSPDAYTRTRGEYEVARQIDDAKTELMNLRVGVLTSFMTFGACYFDGDGVLLGDSTGAVDTLSWQLPANNTGTLNSRVTTWSNAATDIPGQVLTLKAAAKQETGYELKETYYGINVPGYLTTNNKLKDFLYRNEPMNADYLNTGLLPPKMLQLKWTAVHGVKYEKNDGTEVTFDNANIVTFAPKMESWYDLMEGKYPVPKKIGIMQNTDDLLNNLEEVAGMFAYGQICADNPSIKLNYGDTFLPYAMNGRAIYIATVT
jgi:hypothetical protein